MISFLQRAILIALFTCGLAACATGPKNILSADEVSALRISEVTVNTGKTHVPFPEDNEHLPRIAQTLKTRMIANLGAHYAPGTPGASHLSIDINAIVVQSHGATVLGLSTGGIRSTAYLIGPEGKTVRATYVSELRNQPNPMARSHVNGIPVGLLLSAVVVAATQPDMVEPMGTGAADDLSRQLLAK